MTYKENTPTFNSGNRKIVNYKDFIQNEPQEEQELKDIKRSFKKSEVGTQEHKLKYNKVTHKMDDLVEGEVDDKLDSLEEGFFSDRYKEEDTDVLKPLTIEEFSNLREAMYAVKTSEDPSAFQSKEFFSNSENFENVIKKLRNLMSIKESSDFRKEMNHEKVSHDSLICPYCDAEQADHPENIMSGGGGEAPEFAECECDTCGAKFAASKSVIVEYTTDRI